MRICISTDYHLSYKQYGLDEREKDFNIRFKKMIDMIINEKPDIFLTLGDIFNTPYPKPINMKIYADGINKLKMNNIKCYGIIGNHTNIQRKDYYQIDNLFNAVQLIGGDYVAFDDVYICGVNYHSKSYNIKPEIDRLYDMGKEYRVKIILLHQALKADQFIGYDYDEKKLGLDRFDYVFLGHLHKRIVRYDEKTDTVYHYPGSLNSCNVVELADEMLYGRGYTVFDTDSLVLEMKSVESVRKFFEYNVKDDDLNDVFVGEVIEFLSGFELKPIVMLNVVGNDGKRIYDVCEKLKDYTLFVKYKLVPPNIKVAPLSSDERITFNGDLVFELMKRHFDEDWKSSFCYDLYELLGGGDVAGAKSLADFVFSERWGNMKK